MRITLEFKDLRDLLWQIPKFATLVGSDEPFEKRMMQAIEPDPQVMTIQVKPTDGVPFTEEQKRGIFDILEEFVKDPEHFAENHKDAQAMNPPEPQEAPVFATTEATDSAPEAKTKKSSPKPEKPAEKPTAPQDEAAPKVSETEARARLNKLVKERSNAAVRLIFKHFGIKNFTDLKAEQYAEAVALADKITAMDEDEYAEELKKNGIKNRKAAKE